MSIVVDTPDRHNWLTRIVDFVSFFERTRRRFGESMIGIYLLQMRRSRSLRKPRSP